jgi:Holliday junction resolvase RusA-like endonuclease
MILNIPPCSKPRMTQRDRWKKRQCVLDFFAFRDRIKQEIKKIDTLLIKEPPFDWDNLTVIFLVPMPKSWSKKKKASMAGKPMQQRPDLDNYLKGLFDATHKEDSSIWKVTASKIWTNCNGKIIIN